jgi:hypothetical protein
MPEILRLHRMGIAPQPCLGFHRRALGRCVSLAIGRTLLVLILLVVPRLSGLDLIEAYVLAVG